MSDFLDMTKFTVPPMTPCPRSRAAVVQDELDALDQVVRLAQALRRDWNEGAMARAAARDAFVSALESAPIGLSTKP